MASESSMMERKDLIAIPSKGRIGWLKKQKHHSLQLRSNEHPIIVFLNSNEKYYDEYCDYCNSVGFDVRAMHDSKINFSSKAYDYIIKYASDNGFERLHIIDDDLQFFELVGRDFSNGSTTRTLSVDSLVYFMSLILCENAPLASVPYQFERIGISKLINFTGKTMNCYFIHVETFVKNNWKFYRNEVMDPSCDLDINLKLLTNGYFTPRLNNFNTGSNTYHPGGCSMTRTIERINNSIDALKEMYPSFVSIGEGKDGIHSVKCKFKKAFDEKLFYKRVCMSAEDWAKGMRSFYEAKYAIYIKELWKNGARKNKLRAV